MIWKTPGMSRKDIYLTLSDMILLNSIGHKTIKPVTKPTDPATTKPTTKPVTKPTDPKTTKPTTKPVTKPTDPTTTKPTTKPVTEPTDPTTTKPTTKPVTKPTDPTTTKPTTKPTSTLVTENEVTEWLQIRASAENKDYGDTTCGPHKELKEYREVMQYWVDLAKQLNLTYFLSCGSLIGAWRDEQIIPWDTDLDVLLDSKDNIKLDRIKDKRPFGDDDKVRVILQEDWRLLPYSKRRRLTCANKEVPAYSGLCAFQDPVGRIIKRDWYMDIYDYTIKDGYVNDLVDYLKLYKVEDVFPRKKCKFMDIETICPTNPHAVLKVIYGDNIAPKYICKNTTWVRAKKP